MIFFPNIGQIIDFIVVFSCPNHNFFVFQDMLMIFGKYNLPFSEFTILTSCKCSKNPNVHSIFITILET